jgi:serine/threonine protein kinase
VLDFGSFSSDDSGADYLYVCTEYLGGGSLSQRLEHKDVFSLDQVSSVISRMCEALQHLHDRGVTHSGLKPSAIVFDEEDNPFLTDFALATRVGKEGRQGSVGVPVFSSPEQLTAEDPVPASDQYSLAVLAYLLITGSVPHEGQDQPEIRNRNFQRGPLSAHEMAANNSRAPVPIAVSAVLSKAMSVAPGDRFSKIIEFGKALDAARQKPDIERPRQPSVFISYQRSVSGSCAFLIQRWLEKEYGIIAFLDAQGADKAGRFPPRLQHKIENSDVFVCLLAESTLKSDWVKREIEIAHRASRPMIPIFQESFQHPDDPQSLEPHLQDLLMFGGIHFLDLRNLYIDAAIEELSRYIHELANSGSTSAATS